MTKPQVFPSRGSLGSVVHKPGAQALHTSLVCRSQRSTGGLTRLRRPNRAIGCARRVSSLLPHRSWSARSTLPLLPRCAPLAARQQRRISVTGTDHTQLHRWHGRRSLFDSAPRRRAYSAAGPPPRCLASHSVAAGQAAWYCTVGQVLNDISNFILSYAICKRGSVHNHSTASFAIGVGTCFSLGRDRARDHRVLLILSEEPTVHLSRSGFALRRCWLHILN